MTLYAIHPLPPSGSLEDVEVVDESPYGWDFLKQTVTLWRLVDDKRADDLQALKDRVVAAATAEDRKIQFDTPDLHELIRLVTGVDDAILAAGIVDPHWRVPVDRLEELAQRVPAMDIKTERPIKAKTNALAEVMINAVSLRNFLNDAIRQGCIVVYD